MLVYSKVPGFFEIANQSTFSFLQPASSVSCCRCCAAPPVAVEGQPGPLLLALASTHRTEAPHRPLPSRWSLHRLATRPRDHRRSPPRRRGGELAAEPRPSISLAQPHYKYPRKLLPSFFCLFPTPRAQNVAAAPPRTPVSLTPPSNRASTAPPPALTPLASSSVTSRSS